MDWSKEVEIPIVFSCDEGIQCFCGSGEHFCCSWEYHFAFDISLTMKKELMLGRD